MTIPESYAGAVMGDISASRGRVTGMETDERGDTVVIAQAPLAELTYYSTRLRSITRGTPSRRSRRNDTRRHTQPRECP